MEGFKRERCAGNQRHGSGDRCREGHKGALEGGTPTFAVLGNRGGYLLSFFQPVVFTGGFRRRMVESSVNTFRGHRVGLSFFRQGTGSSVDWQM